MHDVVILAQYCMYSYDIRTIAYVYVVRNVSKVPYVMFVMNVFTSIQWTYVHFQYTEYVVPMYA